MGTDRGFRLDGTLAQEFITLPDGTQVTKKYDKTGVCTTEEKYYRIDGTLYMKKEYNEKGQWVTIKYDQTGKKLIEDAVFNDEVRVLVKSAELLSKKGLKCRLSLLQKQRGE